MWKMETHMRGLEFGDVEMFDVAIRYQAFKEPSDTDILS